MTPHEAFRMILASSTLLDAAMQRWYRYSRRTGFDAERSMLYDARPGEPPLTPIMAGEASACIFGVFAPMSHWRIFIDGRARAQGEHSTVLVEVLVVASGQRLDLDGVESVVVAVAKRGADYGRPAGEHWSLARATAPGGVLLQRDTRDD